MQITKFVPDFFLSELAKRIARATKQATKLGVLSPELELTGRTQLMMRRKGQGWEPYNKSQAQARAEFYSSQDLDTPGGLQRGEVVSFVEVTLTGEQPKLPGGWELIAVIDHRESRPIVRMVPGAPELPQGQRDRGPICDHCKKIRQRSDTMILLDESGTIVQQVGRSCLGDFLGKGATDPAKMLAFFEKIGSLLDSDFDGEFCPKAEMRLDVADIVLISGAIINNEGWVSRAASNSGGGIATAEQVLNYLFWSIPAGAAGEALRAWKEQIRSQITPELEAEALDALTWAKKKGEEESASDFDLNLSILAGQTSCRQKNLGFVAYIIAGYRKDQARLILKEREERAGANSQWVGDIGNRELFSLTLESVKPIDSDFGESFLCSFSDHEGNQIRWFASSNPQSAFSKFQGWAIGETKLVKATVKKHQDWKGAKQTMVNRVVPG